MLERMKRAARDRVVRAMTEANAIQSAELGESLTAARRELATAREEIADLRTRLDAVPEQILASEIRSRRDLFAAAEREAASTSARFVGQHFLRARNYPHPHDTLRAALALAPSGGMVLEFGVYSGTTLGILAAARTETVFGFDVFTGLPEDWRPGFRAGAFVPEGDLPEVEGADLVVGLFEDTLPGFLDEHPGPVDLAHVDCDLYSATVTVLAQVGPRLRPGAVVVFDEYFNHQNWEIGEHQAWVEHVERTGLTFEYVAYTHDSEQVAVQVLTNPQWAESTGSDVETAVPHDETNA